MTYRDQLRTEQPVDTTVEMTAYFLIFLGLVGAASLLWWVLR